MIRLPRDMSGDDVGQWLNGGVFLVRTKDMKDYVPVEWHGQSGGGRVAGIGVLDRQLYEVPHTSCYAFWPELGSLNTTHGYAVYMSRRAERQYRRTYNHRCIDVIAPWAFVVSRQLGYRTHHLTSWGNVMFAPWQTQYPRDIDEAERWIADGKPTVAVNRRLIIGGTPAIEKRMLYLDGALAATVVGGELFPTCGRSELAALNKYIEGRYNVNANSQ